MRKREMQDGTQHSLTIDGLNVLNINLCCAETLCQLPAVT